MIDSHHHFWKYSPEKDTWISEKMKILKSDFLPDHLLPHLKQHGFEGSVAVQATQSLEETHFLLSLASEHPFIKGVVGWIDLRAEDLDEQLHSFSRYEKLKGFRHVIQGEPDGFMSQPKFIEGVKTLEKYAYTYDLLVYSHQLEEALKVMPYWECVPIVIDHIAKPSIRTNEIEPWKKYMTAMSSMDNVYCKISGMVTEAMWGKWSEEQFKRYLDVVFDNFGANKIMYGSDWPVCLLSASYKEQLDIVLNYISQFSESERQNILGHNARKFYKL